MRIGKRMIYVGMHMNPGKSTKTQNLKILNALKMGAGI